MAVLLHWLAAAGLVAQVVLRLAWQRGTHRRPGAVVEAMPRSHPAAMPAGPLVAAPLTIVKRAPGPCVA